MDIFHGLGTEKELGKGSLRVEVDQPHAAAIFCQEAPKMDAQTGLAHSTLTRDESYGYGHLATPEKKNRRALE